MALGPAHSRTQASCYNEYPVEEKGKGEAAQ